MRYWVSSFSFLGGLLTKLQWCELKKSVIGIMLIFYLWLHMYKHYTHKWNWPTNGVNETSFSGEGFTGSCVVEELEGNDTKASWPDIQYATQLGWELHGMKMDDITHVPKVLHNHEIGSISALEWATLVEWIVLGSSLNELYFGILTRVKWFSRIASSLAIVCIKFIWGMQNFLGYLVPPY